MALETEFLPLLLLLLTPATTYHALSNAHSGRHLLMRAQQEDLPRIAHKLHLTGDPISPVLADDGLLVRYMYDGGKLTQGRLCQLNHTANSVAGIEILRALQRDGVNFSRFYACVRESAMSGGSWLPLLKDYGVPSEEDPENDMTFPLLSTASSSDDVVPSARRVDVKLFRRDGCGMDAARAEQVAQSSGRIARTGYFGIGVVGAKDNNNVGTLWRSAYQLGAAFLFTIGSRYKSKPTDTVHATTRVPLFELSDWSNFAQWAPRGCRWVAVEMGGVPLEEFEHPLDAVYLLGSEDTGLPTSVLRACHERVALSSVNYASYNVAVAGSLIMYDRMAKMKKRAERGDSSKGTPTRNMECAEDPT